MLLMPHSPIYRPAVGTWQTSWSDTFGFNSAGWGGYTLRTTVPASLITLSGSALRFRMVGVTSGANAVVASCYVGEGATTGDIYDFATTPTQVFVGGSGSFTVAVGTTVVCDTVSLAVDETKPMVFSWYFTSGDIRRKGGSTTGTGYAYTNSNVVSNIDVTLSSVSPEPAFVDMLEVFA